MHQMNKLSIFMNEVTVDVALKRYYYHQNDSRISSEVKEIVKLLDEKCTKGRSKNLRGTQKLTDAFYNIPHDKQNAFLKFVEFLRKVEIETKIEDVLNNGNFVP